MLSDEEIRQDLAQLKEIVAAHKAADAELAVHTEVIDGIELPVFSKVPANLGKLYALGLQEPDLPFLVYMNERFSFGETIDLSRRLGRILLERYGIGRGDRVAICARNSTEWCISYMAVTQIGAIVVPMNSWWKGPELNYGLSDSGSRLVIADLTRRLPISKKFS